MKRSRVTEEQIIGVLKDGGGSEIVPVERFPDDAVGPGRRGVVPQAWQ